MLRHPLSHSLSSSTAPPHQVASNSYLFLLSIQYAFHIAEDGREGWQSEREGVARPGWWSALPSPPTRRGVRGWQDVRPSRRCPAAGRSVPRWWRGVAIASPRSGRGGRPSLSLSASTSGRSGERLAMVWTVDAADGTEERRRTGEDGGGIIRPGSLSLRILFALLLFPSSPPEGRGRGRGGQDGRTSRRCPVAAVRWR